MAGHVVTGVTDPGTDKDLGTAGDNTFGVGTALRRPTLGAVTVTGALTGNVLSAAGITSVTAASVDGRIEAGLGGVAGSSMGSVTATGGNIADTVNGVGLRALQNITTVSASRGTISANVTATNGTITTVTAGGNLSGDLGAGQDITTVTVTGKLSGDVVAGRNIGTVTAGSMDPDIEAQTGTIGTIRTTSTTADLTANIYAAQGITSVSSARDLLGRVISGRGITTITAGRDLAANVVAGWTDAGTDGIEGTADDGLSATAYGLTTVTATRHLTGNLLASGVIGAVRASTGTLSGDVLAAGNVTSVTAATIDGTCILAGYRGAANKDVGTVTAGAGGIQNSQVGATRHITTVTAGGTATGGGIKDTVIAAGRGAGLDGQLGTADDGSGADGAFGTADDAAGLYAGVITTVSTTGYLEDVTILAGVNPGTDGRYGQVVLAPGESADNQRNASAAVRTVTAAAIHRTVGTTKYGYSDDVRIISGSTLGTITLAGRVVTKSETHQDADLTTCYLTLIRNGTQVVV
jgi:hypothetical protein